MNALSPTVFTFPDKSPVRVVMKAGEPWFVAVDVCDVLEHSNSRMAVDRLDDDEKGVSNVYTLGGVQELSVVNESGLYHLVITSRKPEAKAFRKWVTAEVLPAIRKKGFYSTGKVTLQFARQTAALVQQINQNPDRASREVLQKVLQELLRPAGIDLSDDIGVFTEQAISNLGPSVPGWVRILQIVIDDIAEKRYSFPFKFESVMGRDCLLIRCGHVAEHLSLWHDRTVLPRSLKRQLLNARVVARKRQDPTIQQDRFFHFMALDLAALERHGIRCHHG